MLRLLAVALISSFALTLAPSALAHNYADGQIVTLSRTAGIWQGHVSDGTSFCENHREVVLRRRGPDGSVRIVSGHTDSTGFYAFDVARKSGPYYVVARRKVRDVSGHRHVCKTSISNELGQQTW